MVTEKQAVRNHGTVVRLKSFYSKSYSQCPLRPRLGTANLLSSSVIFFPSQGINLVLLFFLSSGEHQISSLHRHSGALTCFRRLGALKVKWSNLSCAQTLGTLNEPYGKDSCLNIEIIASVYILREFALKVIFKVLLR